jgi:tRNA threonylcarbamoyladenosine biosynthesis protein TsaE
VRGDVTSPTFVIARTHPNQASGPALQHVDAYRLPSAREFDDLDLETAGAVTVVEWGEGRAEGLSPDRLLIRLEVIDELRRRAALSGSGMRWSDAAVKALIDEVRGSAAR